MANFDIIRYNFDIIIYAGTYFPESKEPLRGIGFVPTHGVGSRCGVQTEIAAGGVGTRSTFEPSPLASRLSYQSSPQARTLSGSLAHPGRYSSRTFNCLAAFLRFSLDVGTLRHLLRSCSEALTSFGFTSRSVSDSQALIPYLSCVPVSQIWTVQSPAVARSALPSRDNHHIQ